MTQKDWKASAWLGIITAGLLWIDFRWVEEKLKSLVGGSGCGVMVSVSTDQDNNVLYLLQSHYDQEWQSTTISLG